MWGDAGSAVLMPSPHKHLVRALINASLKTTDYDLKTLAIYFYHSIGKKRRMYRVGSK